ncbi:MAG: class I SAM-dependent methyltransferase [Actinomycetota bacterium]
MDAKELNALVHDREAAFYDDRFLIDYDRIGRDVRKDLTEILGHPPRARRALDVACGTGYAAVGLAAAKLADEVHASDLSVAMLERTRANAARAHVVVPLALADAERLPYADDSFDLVVARGALHHVPDPLRALTEIRRVLEPGGTAIVLAEPTPGGERQTGAVVGLAVRAVEGLKRLRRVAETEDDRVRHHWELASIAANLHTFEPEDIATLAEKAGFEEIEVDTAWWSWILVLGLNYYLVGESERLARNRVARAIARAAANGAATFDRLVAGRVVPPQWRHTVQAVLR